MSPFVHGPPGEIIEKTMTLSGGEFEKSLARLALEGIDIQVLRTAPGRYRLPAGEGAVAIDVTALEPLMMGGLVALPRCRVVLRFEDMTFVQRAAFLDRFDQAFQRGGG